MRATRLSGSEIRYHEYDATDGFEVEKFGSLEDPRIVAAVLGREEQASRPACLVVIERDDVLHEQFAAET